MSRQQQTRSSLEIGAVAQAAAGGLPKMLPPIVKPRIIAALAGFVLRLFRDRMIADQAASARPRGRVRSGKVSEALREASGKVPGTARIPAGKGPEASRKAAGKLPGTCPELAGSNGDGHRASGRSAPAAAGNPQRGGTSHG